MAKSKPEVSVHSHGLYDGWDRESKELPNLVKISAEIPAALDVEFGYILRIRNARNSKITFRIEHPPFKDSNGELAPPFEGELYVKTNDFRFFLGDTIWAPLEDKRGEWRLITWLDGAKVADKTLTMI
ncbi:DUF3859 domain-containing protein [Pontiella sulfatireligans]|uniref:DUF3859 domain-containing protein n=1 Tax=Pontiella sulfatireligans TaxID=2750658 RepID=A0A6C2UJT5_9BACT|nr:DUF3859 domain-containing protein [Pontiella sulfatireligans]VGO19456.1 hypothetical protein SCARR_01514 [Pontiella sulfatireligans]